MNLSSHNLRKQRVWFNPDIDHKSFKFAVFADRDGNLLEHVDYLGDPERVELLPGVKEAVQSIVANQGAFFILTNQSGVDRGYYSLSDVFACNQRMLELMAIDYSQVAGCCIATGLPGGHDAYRKPSPRFIDESIRQFSMSRDYVHMIGDSAVDLETAQNANVHGWLVANGKPQAVADHHAGNLPFDYRFKPDFASCIDSILACSS